MEHLQRAARHLADQGRGPDSHLVHMTTKELQALSRLAPDGKLSRNPRTGLPEAGFLDDILPMAIGLGATFLTGGAAAPLVGAAASGLTKTAMTGDIGQGLMTGLLSYGAGSALNSLAAPAASGAAGAAGATSSAATQGAAAGLGDAAAGFGNAAGGLGGSAGSLGGTAAGNAGGAGLTSSLGSAAAAPSAGQFASLGGAPLQNFGGGLPAPDVSSPIMEASTGSLGGDLVTPSLAGSSSGSLAPSLSGSGAGTFGAENMSIMDKLSAAGTNLQNDPGGTLSRTFIDNYANTTVPMLVGYAGSMDQGGANIPKEPTAREMERRYPAIDPDPETYRYNPPPADYNQGNGLEWDFYPGMAAGGGVHGYYAEGGIADAHPKTSMKANIEAEAKMAIMDNHPKAKEALRRYADVFGEDALKELTRKLDSLGGRIRGAGGGLDDLIPGTIEGRKEVRLADGEFVVPADVVSHLGDGSSDHGVRKLTEMMDRIRKTKTGTTKQAGHIKDKKVLPA